MASNDDMTPDLLAQAKKRPPTPEAEEVLRRSRQLVAEEASGQSPQTDVKPDPQRDAVKATLSLGDVAGAAGRFMVGRSPVQQEAAIALMGGVRDAGQELISFVDDSANWLNDNFLNLRTQSQQAEYDAGVRAPKLPEVPQNETTAGNIARSVTQFAVPFMGYLKATSRSVMLAKAGKSVQGAVAGAATDATAFDPHQQRLSNAILEWTDHSPVLGESVFNYLASQPGDSNAEGRLKNTLEGLGLGVAAELALRSIKLFKGRALAEGKDPVKQIDEAHAAQTKAATEADAAGATEQGAAPKPADAAPEGPQPKQGQLFEDSHAPVDPEAARVAPALEASLKRPEVAGIAPIESLPKQAPRIAGKQVDELVAAMKEGRTADVAKTLDESDFNLAKLDTGEDVKNVIDAVSKTFEKNIDVAKHGVQSFGDIKKMADLLGAGTKSLRELYGNTDNLAARLFAHRTLLTASAEKVNSLIPAAMTGDSEAILALRKHVALHATMQAQMKGAQTEVGRALSQFRIKSKSVDLAINERNGLIEAMGGHQANIEFAQKLSSITDPRKFNDVTRRAAMARTPDALFEAWVNGMLSNPVTHAANLIGNSLAAIGSVVERANASAIGTARGLVFRDPQEAIRSTEVKAYLFGMMEGLKDAVHISADGLRTLKDAAGQWRAGNAEEARRMVADSSDMGNAWKTFATDSPVVDNAAFGTRQYELQTPAITADNLPRLTNLIGRSTVEHLGVLARTPGRFLAASDELFKTVFYRGELKAQAYRDGISKGLAGEELATHIARTLEDPAPDLAGAALKAAREGTFTSPLGKAGRSIQSVVANVPGARYIMPFVRTPVNIVKYTFDRMPALNLMQEQNRAILAAGGPQADLLMSRWATGGALLALGSYLSSQGIITGGGMDKKRGSEQLANEQAYSIKVGDKYYAFNRVDPLGMFLGLSADFQQIAGHLDDTERSKLATAAVLSVSKNLVSKSYLSGLVDAIDTFSQNSPGKWQKWMNRQAGSVVPAGVAQVAKQMDPEQKEVWSMWDAVRARIPGMSKDVPPHVNLFGDDVKYEGGLGPDIASPITQATANVEPGALEVSRLNVDLQHPLRQIGGSPGGDAGASGVELSPVQYHRLMKILGKEAAGKGFKNSLNEWVQSPAYAKLPEDASQTMYAQGKEKSIRLLYENMKQAATMQLLTEDKDLRDRFMKHQRNKGNAVLGLPIQPVN